MTHTRSLLGLYLPTLAISFAQGMVLPAVPALATHFPISPGTAAQIVTAQAAGRMAALFPSGMLVDRLGPAAVLLAGSISIAAGGFMMLVPAFWGVLAGQFLIGIGSSLWLAGREISGLNLVRQDQRGRLMSGFFGFQMAGMAVGPLAGGVLVDAAGLWSLFFWHAALAAAILIFTMMVETRSGAAHVVAATPAPALGGFREIPRDDRMTFAILIFATFSMSLYRMSLNSLLPLHAGVSVGLSGTQVGTLFGITSLGIILMIVPAGLILDRIGRKWAAVPAAILPALSFAAMPLARDLSALSAVAGLLGLANGLSLGSISTFSYDVIPERARGRLQAMRRLVGDAGSLTGPLIGGLVADRYSAASAFLAFAPLMALTALLLAFGTRETLHRGRIPVVEDLIG